MKSVEMRSFFWSVFSCIPVLDTFHAVEQIYFYFDKLFSKNQCDFCKSFNAQHIRLPMIEKAKISRYNKQFLQLF